ncbi:cobalt-precorrin-2 C(20)-methyltransferase, partial [Halorubrum ezzemoulense]|nr:cobalt-precorrin-2 C(20)-methyltransferase [Halorubrum ezzemoulense]
TFGRRLFMDTEEALVTNDPGKVTDRDYYTLAYADKREATGSA